jgi:glucosamine--fructose-6-phosphate aminotransferase (isomerizing)
MCGIVGYIGKTDAVPIIMSGLHRLEYRGYDSAGVAVISNGKLVVRKKVGKLKVLDQSLEQEPIPGSCGIGHTRWATHGIPSEVNSHPHSDNSGKIMVVHNGIIENYKELKDEMIKEGHVFKSQTDTEVAAHLIGKHYKGNLEEAVRNALKEVEGAYALGVICADEPDKLVAARCGSPLIVGIGEGENFIGSDVPAILKYTRKVVYLDDFEVMTLTRDKAVATDLDGNVKDKKINVIDWDADAAEKGGFPHFMLKEINEQPKVIANTLLGRFSKNYDKIKLDDMKMSDEQLKAIKKIVIISCGTAYHAGVVGRYLLEHFVRIPVEVDLASEFRYRDPMVDKDTLVITVTQSGETADTLAGLREAKRKGSKVISICNVVGSSIARDSDGVIYTNAGPEIGVASTKAYTSQVTAFVLFTLYLGQLLGTISEADEKNMIDELRALPEKVKWQLENQQAIIDCTEKYYKATSALYLGRSYNYPSALEGALKLKEISYIHAEGYAAGEMKHGPIALVDDKLPVICVCTDSVVYDKMVSNIQEIKARNGRIVAVATEGDQDIKAHAEDVIYIPKCAEFISPILVQVPLQLFSYHMAVKRGCDVDQPRNLAKSVTVE